MVEKIKLQTMKSTIIESLVTLVRITVLEDSLQKFGYYSPSIAVKLR